MLVDGIQLIEGSEIVNLTVASGATFPTMPDTGELFYMTGSGVGLYIYTGTAWEVSGSGSGSGGGGGGPFTISGDVSGTIDGGTDALTLATVNPNVGSFGESTNVANFTVNAKGLITNAGQTVIQIAESQVTDGSLLARNAGNEVISGTWSFNNPVTGVDPTASTHLTTKQYVDSVASGLDPKNSVRVGTTANITLSGTQTIDGVAVIAGDRVLVKNQTTAAANGIYVVAAGAWTRASDFDGSPAAEVSSGAFTFISEGTAQADTGWVLATNDPITLDSTAQTWTQFSSAVSAAAAGSTTQVQYNNAGAFAGSANFTWTDATRTLTLGTGTAGSAIIKQGLQGNTLRLETVAATGVTAGDITLAPGTSNVSGGSINLFGGTSSGFGTSGGSISLYAGDVGDANGGQVVIQGGGSTGSGRSGGDIHVNGGLAGASGFGGNINFSTATTTSRVERMRITRTGALAFAGANNYGTSGQVLTSNGNSTPSWQAATPPTTISATGAFPTVTTATSGIFGGVGASSTALGFIRSDAPLNEKYWNLQASNTGTLTLFALNDAISGSTTPIVIDRNGTQITTITLTTLGLNLVISTGGLLLNGVAGTTGQVLTSNGASAAPTWQQAPLATVNSNVGSFGSASTIPVLTIDDKGRVTAASTVAVAAPVVTQLTRVTTFDSAARGKRVAITAGVTIPSGTYAAGDIFSFYNETSNPVTLTQGAGLTLRQDGTANTGNRVLAGFGTCTLWFNSASEAILSGSVS